MGRKKKKKKKKAKEKGRPEGSSQQGGRRSLQGDMEDMGLRGLRASRCSPCHTVSWSHLQDDINANTFYKRGPHARS